MNAGLDKNGQYLFAWEGTNTQPLMGKRLAWCAERVVHNSAKVQVSLISDGSHAGGKSDTMPLAVMGGASAASGQFAKQVRKSLLKQTLLKAFMDHEEGAMRKMKMTASQRRKIRTRLPETHDVRLYRRLLAVLEFNRGTPMLGATGKECAESVVTQ